MKRYFYTVTLVLLVLLLSVSGATGQGPDAEEKVQLQGDVSAATVNSRISFQGRLVESGTPVTGDRDMTFRLYSDGTCSTMVGRSIVLNGVPVTDGLFSVKLDVDQSDFDGQGLWLKVVVGGTAVIGCEEILPAPYALSLRPGAIISDTFSYVELNRFTTGFGATKYGLYAESGGPLFNYGVYGKSDGTGVGGYSESGFGVSGSSDSNTGVRGYSDSGVGVYGLAGGDSGANYGVYGRSDSASGYGVYGEGDHAGVGASSDSGVGVRAVSDSGTAVSAKTTSGTGVYVESLSGKGVHVVSGGVGVRVFTSDTGLLAETYGDSAAVDARNMGDGIAIRGESTSTDATLILRNDGSGDLIRGFSHGDWTHRFRVENDGRTTVSVLAITGGSDLSEPFDVTTAKGEVSPGLVVCIDANQPGKLLVCDAAYDRTVAGVVSGAGGIKTGMLMGQRDSPADGAHPVALTGRVYAWADASAGPIQPGDLLTTSERSGHVMRVSDYAQAQGAVIGKAMSSLDRGQGLVLVLVSLQ